MSGSTRKLEAAGGDISSSVARATDSHDAESNGSAPAVRGQAAGGPN